MSKKIKTMTVLAAVLLAGGALAVKADSIVYATTGGQMRQTLERAFYQPFAKEAARTSSHMTSKCPTSGPVSKR